MKTLKWKVSLVTKLTVLFTAILICLWIMVEFLLYSNTFNRILDRNLIAYGELNTLKSEVSNSLFSGAKHDAIQFDSHIHGFHQINTVNASALVAHYFPLSSKDNHSDANIQRWITQTFGSAAQHRYLDSFIYQPGKGITIYGMGNNFKQRLKEIQELSNIKTNDGFRWSNPAIDKKTGIFYLIFSYTRDFTKPDSPMVGFIINLTASLNLDNRNTSGTTSFLIAANGQMIPQPRLPLSSSTISKLKETFVQNQTVTHETMPDTAGKYYIIKEYIPGPDWLQVTLIPRTLLRDMALAPFYSALPWSFLSLALMVLILLHLLQINLANPISRFVNIIGSDTQPTFNRRLPTNDYDELGQIAKAYNQLLDTIKDSHEELEKKVTQRTRELAISTEQAEQANQRKSRHLTDISHEIRTPLNGMLGSLELLRNTELSKKQADLGETAHHCASSLLSIINNLLDFSRIEAGQIQLNYQPVSLAGLADDAILTIQSRIINKPISLTCLINKGVPSKALIDPVRVRQILVNLLGNAAKFTENGAISLRIDVVRSHLYFSVEDTGNGIAIEEQQRIFEPFTQSHHQKVGTGLGLPISVQLAKKMKGQLTMYSTLGRGSTFILDLPLLEPSSPLRLPRHKIKAPKTLHHQLSLWGALPVEGSNEALEDPALVHLPGRLWRKLHDLHNDAPEKTNHQIPRLLPWQLKVLLVDDVDTNREIISLMLAELGQDVIDVHSGEAALQQGRRHIFDLVLMDIRMPRMNGYEATHKWRHDESILDTDCPIFALTANANPLEHSSPAASDMSGYLTKPVSLAELNQALEHAADLQLDRDIQLTINTEAGTPLVNSRNTSISHKLVNQLTDLIDNAKQLITQKKWLLLSDTLHIIKGSAGLAGITPVFEAASELESKLETSQSLALSELSPLEDRIQDFINEQIT